jgi:hypothetical protein
MGSSANCAGAAAEVASGGWACSKNNSAKKATIDFKVRVESARGMSSPSTYLNSIYLRYHTGKRQFKGSRFKVQGKR